MKTNCAPAGCSRCNAFRPRVSSARSSADRAPLNVTGHLNRYDLEESAYDLEENAIATKTTKMTDAERGG